jgi:hypothetical protein
VLHLSGNIQLANTSAQPIPIARVTAQLMMSYGGSTPLTPIMFTSPLTAGARMTLPFAMAVRAGTDMAAGAGVRIVVSVPGSGGMLQAGTDIPLSMAIPRPRVVTSAQITLRTQLLLTDTGTFAATLGVHPAGTVLLANGARLVTTPALPAGGSRAYRLDLEVAAQHGGSGRLLATTQLADGDTDVTACVADTGCPDVGVVLIGGE